MTKLLGIFSARGTNAMVFFLSISNVFSNVLAIISGLLIAKWILPEQLGVFNSFTILSSYIILAQVGLPMALGRNYPFYLGSKQLDKANESVAISHSWALILCGSTLFVGSAVTI